MPRPIKKDKEEIRKDSIDYEEDMLEKAVKNINKNEVLLNKILVALDELKKENASLKTALRANFGIITYDGKNQEFRIIE